MICHYFSFLNDEIWLDVYGPSNLSKIVFWAQRAGPLFWDVMEGRGCCMEPTTPLGLASGILGPFFIPISFPPALVYGLRGQGL